MKSNSCGFTLLELLIAIILLSVIALGFASIEKFSTHQTISTSTQASLQNKVSFALEHITKEISKARGNEMTMGANQVINWQGNQINFLIGTDPGNAQNRSSYRLDNQDQILYCPQCADLPCASCTPNWGSRPDYIIAKKVKIFNIIKPADALGRLSENNITAEITACKDSGQAQGANNPCVKMQTKIFMPAVSTN